MGEGRHGYVDTSAQRNEVVIDGVKLTRAQVEAAIKKLNEPPQPKPGQRVRHQGVSKSFYIVLEPSAAVVLAKYYNYSDNDITKRVWVVSLETGAVHTIANEYIVIVD